MCLELYSFLITAKLKIWIYNSTYSLIKKNAVASGLFSVFCLFRASSKLLRLKKTKHGVVILTPVRVYINKVMNFKFNYVYSFFFITELSYNYLKYKYLWYSRVWWKCFLFGARTSLYLCNYKNLYKVLVFCFFVVIEKYHEKISKYLMLMVFCLPE